MTEARRIVVIGSGPPGATAALFLSRAGADVLLLEAGSERSAMGLTVRLGGVTLANLRRPLAEHPNFVATGDPVILREDLSPGGLTNHWSGAVPRFSPDDFADAARAGEAYRWPIGYDDLAPWYDRVEPLLHVAGASEGVEQVPAGKVTRVTRLGPDWDGIKAAASNMGRSVTTLPAVYGGETTGTPSGTVFNSFVRIVKPELRAGRLTARFGARVRRLEWSPKSRRVESVVFEDAETGSENTVPCRAVVVAASAIRSAEILLASRSPDFPEGLGNTHGVLGRYLHDHPEGKVRFALRKPITLLPASYVTRPHLDRSSPLYAAAGTQWGGTALWARSLPHGGRLSWIAYNIFGTMIPTRDDFVSFDSTRRAKGSDRLTVHIRYPKQAIDTLASTRDDLRGMLESAGFAPQVDGWFLSRPGDSNHFGGVCRMHASPEWGLLDGWNRVHAVRNVAVVDSAAFTTGPEKNPVLTAMAIAARAATRVADEMRAGDL